ncbi:MAG: patatin-like phospholipase family protein [Xanthomonadales bacterium]|nr:patatin-like phospholipase family protein [Xanthomonadales bacterium]
MKFILMLVFGLFVGGCAHKSQFPNHRISSEDLKLTIPKRFEQYGHNDDVSIILTFSGGGTRAAAFAYGVMQGLKETPIQLNSTSQVEMLSLVDVISSVSGGSFTSAYYGLFGDKLFTDFEADFLKTTLQSRLTRQLLVNPINWFRFMSGNYNRSDLTAQHYQKHIFKDKTFADMRSDAPLIMINATDIATGAGFTFSDEHFRWLCSDLSAFPVGKAVTASSAVPVLFSPVLIKNHGGCLPYEFQLETISDEIRYQQQALIMRRFLDKERYPYLHLVDGGVADNLGVRAILNQIYGQDNNFWQTLKAYRLDHTKKVLFLVVNAAATLNGELSKSPKTPGLTDTLNAVTTIQSQNYNADTLDLLELSAPKWQAQVREGRCQEYFSADCNDFSFHVTELNFTHVGEPLASELATIATALQLPDEQVDKLIAAGKDLVRQSPVVQSFIKEIEAK